MPEPALVLFYDYVDPVSWFESERVFTALDKGPPRARSRVAFRGFEASPANGPPLDATNQRWRARTDWAAQRLETLGLALVPPLFLPRTGKAHELAMHAAEKGAFDRVHRDLFRAHLCESRDIGRIDVLVDLARLAGLDAAEAKAVLDVDRFREAHARSRQEALEAGVRGVPAWLLRGRPEESVSDAALAGVLQGGDGNRETFLDAKNDGTHPPESDE